MRLSARTKLLERRLPPTRRTVHESEVSRALLLAETVEHAVGLGCGRHLEEGELGKITNGEWFSRLSDDELVLIHDDARRILAGHPGRERERSAQ